jgi:hypothetical protein
MITGRGDFPRGFFCGYRLAVTNQNCSAHLIYVLSLTLMKMDFLIQNDAGLMAIFVLKNVRI